MAVMLNTSSSLNIEIIIIIIIITIITIYWNCIFAYWVEVLQFCDFRVMSDDH